MIITKEIAVKCPKRKAYGTIRLCKRCGYLRNERMGIIDCSYLGEPADVEDFG